MTKTDITKSSSNDDNLAAESAETNGTLNNNMFRWISWGVAIYFLFEILITSWNIQGQYLVTGNISWLLISAERFLNGGTYLNDFYETNPPLSILVYTPHVLFAKLTNIPLTSASYILTLILTVCSAGIVYRILRTFPDIPSEQRVTVVLSYILAMSLATIVFFSDREHIIMLGLVPFMLLQYAITHKIQTPPILFIPILIVGAICILIKPHYGILPATFFLHRIVTQKRFSIYLDKDFIILSLTTLLYLGAIFALFPDYVSTVFPDTLALYDTDKNMGNSWNTIRRYMPVYIAIYFIEYTSRDLQSSQKRFIMFLYTCCILCLIPYWVQMKGYYNHIIPPNGFFIMAFSLSLSFRIKNMIAKLRPLHIAIPILVLSTIVSIAMPLNPSFPRKQEIPELPVGVFLKQHCPAPCKFLAFHSDIEIINPTAAYMDGYTHISRFPTLWFIPEILNGLQSNDAEKKKHAQELQKKYAEYFTEDINRHSPSVLLIASNIQVGQIENFDLIDFFSVHEELTDMLYRDYEYADKFEYDRAEYFKGTSLRLSHTITYDVYILRK